MASVGATKEEKDLAKGMATHNGRMLRSHWVAMRSSMDTTPMTEEETWEDEDVTYEVYASMLEHGLDEEDYDALAYAAEVAQAESEAYFMRQKAKGSGHSSAVNMDIGKTQHAQKEAEKGRARADLVRRLQLQEDPKQVARVVRLRR